ncbi:putative protease [Desulfovibrionales bacterium]
MTTHNKRYATNDQSECSTRLSADRGRFLSPNYKTKNYILVRSEPNSTFNPSDQPDNKSSNKSGAPLLSKHSAIHSKRPTDKQTGKQRRQLPATPARNITQMEEDNNGRKQLLHKSPTAKIASDKPDSGKLKQGKSRQETIGHEEFDRDSARQKKSNRNKSRSRKPEPIQSACDKPNHNRFSKVTVHYPKSKQLWPVSKVSGPVIKPETASATWPVSPPGRWPEILAQAEDTQTFLAALAAGADGVYIGLKSLSSHMQSGSLTIHELAGLTELARHKGSRTYIALNILIKTSNLSSAGRLLECVVQLARPDGLIVQDLGALKLAYQVGFEGELHLSTLAGITHPSALLMAHRLGISRVVLPQELNIDEVKAMAAACPEGLTLEVFVHGALCFCISGRCWFSNLVGGKSNSSGWCMQSCRRVYKQRRRKERFFSPLDLSLDVLTKPLLDIPKVAAWTIEGHKRGSHYVFYTTTAYKLLRDCPDDPQTRKQALDLLSRALGRRTSHSTFLPQRPHSSLALNQKLKKDRESASGLLVSKIGQHPPGPGGKPGAFFFKPRFELLAQDLVRIGYEDEPWHKILHITKRVPKAGELSLCFAGQTQHKSGTPVFLIDRREPELAHSIAILTKELLPLISTGTCNSVFKPRLPQPTYIRSGQPLYVVRSLPRGRFGRSESMGVWLSPSSLKIISHTVFPRLWWWLPPVIWPNEEAEWRELIRRLIRDGGHCFVLGSPWQIELFPAQKKPLSKRQTNERTTGMMAADLKLVAGPFCNATNPLALDVLAQLGCSAAVASPELMTEDFLTLPTVSPLPLWIVWKGTWPAGISRLTPRIAKAEEPLFSPKGEVFWFRHHGSNLWLYQDWPLDLSAHRAELEQAGFARLVELVEPLPCNISKSIRRPHLTRTCGYTNSPPPLNRQTAAQSPQCRHS